MTVDESAPATNGEQAERYVSLDEALAHYEALGERLYEHYEATTDFDTRFRNRGGDLEREFALIDGRKVEIKWLQGPELYRPGMPHLGVSRNWLPSGHISVSHLEDPEVNDSFLFGRSLSVGVARADDIVVVKDVWRGGSEQLSAKRLDNRDYQDLASIDDVMSEVDAIIGSGS